MNQHISAWLWGTVPAFSRKYRPVLLATLAVAAAWPAEALTINPVFDSSITSLGVDAATTVENAFDTVARDYASVFANNNVTINIGVSWGSVDGYALPSNAVGASVDPLYGYFSYSAIKSYLSASARSNPGDTALQTAVANLPRSAPSGVSKYVIPAAEMKALGLVNGNSTSIDGYIGFAGSPTGYTFTGANGQIAPGTFDFQAVAAHEIAEVLGRISGLQSSGSTYRTVLDLFRYGSKGNLSFSYNAAAYLSINGGRTDLGNYNNSPSGGDRSDWLTLASSSDVQDAFVSTGENLNLSAADLTALDILGYGGSNLGDTFTSPGQVAFSLVEDVPEPASLSLLASALLAIGFARRRS